MIKKLIALVLVLLMVVPMIASCGGDEPEETQGAETNKKDDVFTKNDDPLLGEINEHISELSSTHNFNGKTFTWVGGGSQAPENEEESGDVQQDALYYRQREIEEKFHIDWENYSPEGVEGQGTHPVVDAVKEDVLSGSGSYDAAYGTPVAVANPLFLADSLADVSNYTTLDFDRAWWPDSLLDTYNINGAIYFLNGPIVSSNYYDTHCVMFNKQVAEDYGIDQDELYALATDGEWTFDKMFEYASKVPENGNNAGAYRYANPEGIATLIAHGLTLTQYDENGAPFVPEAISVEMSDLADKFSAIYSDDTLTVNLKGSGTSAGEDFTEKYGYDDSEAMFADGKILFMFGTTGTSADLRTLDVEFGILPMPKGSATQEDYISYVQPWSAFNVFVPKTTKDETVTDVMLEALAALGQKYIKPAYYDKILKSRSVHDKQSKEMIDIIFNTKKYDIIDFLTPDGDTNSDSSYVKMFQKAFEESSEGFASNNIMTSMMVNMHIEEILADIEANN